MRKLITFVLISSILSIASLPAFAQTTESKPHLIINSISQPLFTTKNKDGFLDVLLLEAFRRIGASFQIVKLPAERGLISANEGIVDGDLSRVKGLNKIYKNLIRVPEALRDADFCALSKNPIILNNPDNLRKYIVGHIKGWKIYEKMMTGSNKVITTDNPIQLIRLLKLNRIEVALYNCINGLTLSRNLGIKEVKILQPSFPKIQFFLYLNKKYNYLIPSLTKALSDLKDEGIYQKLYQEKITLKK